MSLLSTKEIMEIIPHRQPMLLIDTVEEMEIGVRAAACWRAETDRSAIPLPVMSRKTSM